MFSKLKKTITKLLTGVMVTSMGLAMLSPDKAFAANDATINLSKKYQTIRGFGGMNHPLWAGDLTSAQRETAFGMVIIN